MNIVVNPPLDGASVTAPCGCAGIVLQSQRGQFPSTLVLITAGCAGGHPARVAPGVKERFDPALLRPDRAVAVT